MSEIIVNSQNLPSTIEDLSRFVLIGREKLTAVRAEIRAIDKVGLAKDVHDQKLAEAQDIAEAVLDAEKQLGDLLEKIPKATARNNPSGKKKTQIEHALDLGTEPTDIYTEDFDDPGDWSFEEPEQYKTKAEIIKENGLTQKQAEDFQTLARNPELVEQAKAKAREKNDIVTRKNALDKIKQQKKHEEITEAERAVHEQATEEFKPLLTVGDSIGYKPKEKYDLLLTDPPYSTDVDDIDKFVDSWLYNALDNVKDTGFAYVFIGAYPEEQRAYLNARVPEHMTLCQELIWTYKNTLGQNPNDRYKQNYQVCLFYRGVNAPNLDCPLTNEQWAVQEINAPDGRQGDRYHAWQKPMEIAERFVRHSTKHGMTVFDPFACTGTFLLAATKLGRKAYGFEINPDNAKIAFERGCVERG